MNRRIIFAAVLWMTLTSPALLQAAQFPATLNVGQQQLVLNGEGTRSKYFMDLYVAGLYLTQPNAQAKAVIAANELMVMRIKITSKLVSQEKLVATLQEGFNNSTGGNTKPIANQIAEFRKCFAEQIKAGDVFDMVYVPNQGVMVLKNGKRKGSIAGLPFKQALFGVWLGDKPADATLRQALLGPTARR